jgi:predicted small lipoprotein YifL
MRTATRALAVLPLVLVLAACGATGPSPSSAASPSASAGAQSPAVSAGASDSPAPSVDLHGATDLEARLPDQIGGTTLTKVSLKGADFLSTGSSAEQGGLETMLKGLGKTTSDLSLAQEGDPSGYLVLQVGLFRVAGAASAPLLAAWVASQQAATGNTLQVSTETVSGTQVTKLTDPTKPVGGSTYAWAIGDTIALVRADDPKLLDEAVSKVR